VLILPGGVQEMVLANNKELDIFHKHSGFARIAFEKKVPLVPVFAKGENRAAITLNILSGVRRWFIKTTGYPIPTIFLGPIPTTLNMIVGKPLNPSSFSSPSELHMEYYKQLVALIQKHETGKLGKNISSIISGQGFET